MRDRTTREPAPAPEAVQKQETGAESAGSTSLGDLAATEGGYGETASVLAYEGQDKNVAELTTKVGVLVDARFGGDYKKAFAHYDGNKDGGLEASELTRLLKDANVGNALTRGVWVKGIIERLDLNIDDKIEYAELEAVFKETV